MSAVLAWLAESGLTLILGFVAELIRGTLADRRAAKAQRDAGAADHAATVNKETADAQHRAGQAQLDASSGSALDDDLISGRKQF